MEIIPFFGWWPLLKWSWWNSGIWRSMAGVCVLRGVWGLGEYVNNGDLVDLGELEDYDKIWSNMGICWIGGKWIKASSIQRPWATATTDVDNANFKVTLLGNNGSSLTVFNFGTHISDLVLFLECSWQDQSKLVRQIST